MSEILLFHHVQGLTEGVRSLASRLRAGGHVVHTPDLFDGQTAPTLDAGFTLMKGIGEEALEERLEGVLADLPQELVYAGISYGVSLAQRLAQTRPGARGALLYESCFPVTGEWAFGPWPEGVPVQIHGAEGDEFFGEDLPAARELVQHAGAELAELFVYPGDQHLFTDSSLPSYDAPATDLLIERSRNFLDRLS